MFLNYYKYYNINVKKQQVLYFANGGGYKKVEDKFVDTFLKKEGETIEEAKERVRKEQKQLEEQNKARVEETLKKSQEINNKYVK